MDLNGAVAVVTGGNGGLGQRICHALAREGVHIAVIYAQSRDQADCVARELTSRYQINAAAFACDVTDGAAVSRAVAKCGTLRTPRYPRQRRRLQQGNPVRRPRQPDDGGLGQDHCRQPDRTDAADQGSRAAYEGAGEGPHRQYLLGVGSRADRLLDRLCGLEGRADPSDTLHGGGAGPQALVNCVAPGLLEGTRATANFRAEQIENSAATSLLKKPADKDDCADMVVAMCRTETMTGQTAVIDSGRYFP